jgi:hypothetical protein
MKRVKWQLFERLFLSIDKILLTQCNNFMY